MTRIGYDSVTPGNIPVDAAVVGGYVDGWYKWSPAAWARFTGLKVRIAVFSSTNDGHVGDCESGDMTPADAVRWTVMRRAAGCDVTIYCSEAVWGEVRQAFADAGVPEPHWWIAGYPGSVGWQLYAGSVAHQVVDDGPYDRSIVADFWPGVDAAPTPPPPPAPEDPFMAFTDAQAASMARAADVSVWIFLEKLYTDVIEKPVDPHGIVWWFNQIEAGTHTLGSAAAYFDSVAAKAA